MISSLGQDVDETEKEEEKSQLLVLKKMDQETGREKVSCCRQTERLGCCFNEIKVVFLYTL